MCKIQLTVFYEAPFWVGVFERIECEKLSAARIVFGAEPKDFEVWELVLKQYTDLKFSPAIEVESRRVADNPKRRQRAARQQVQGGGVGTKSQQALSAQREERKLEKKSVGRAQREEEAQRKFDLKQQKRKQKHRGH